jgi:hypothetical protein
MNQYQVLSIVEMLLFIVTTGYSVPKQTTNACQLSGCMI